MTRAEFARRMGCSWAKVQRLATDPFACRGRTIQRAWQVLDCTPDELLSWALPKRGGKLLIFPGRR